MVVFPNAKINLGLNILSKREDGYHNLHTVFAPIAVKDVLEIIEAKDATQDVQFSSSGLPVAGELSSNLCVRAYQLLKKDFTDIPPVRMHLHKTIPMGAGLGGGSSDAAFALQLINQKFNLQLSRAQLIGYAAHLGSDCAFFILNRPCYATGRGEVLQPLDLDLTAYKILLVNPGLHINTAQAFSKIVPGIHTTDLRTLLAKNIRQWKNYLHNDFEESVFSAFPEVGAIKNLLYQQGALYASMSGSGSSVYGIFEKHTQPAIKFPQHYFHRWV
ncbi:MAG: 4-(cytidine 5'-diphospho)-2-C-methyl-D-erythritol kinase [Chitinophagaceae bacterium]|nr:MAG: 4-(cytidine 5'-diphospho)-2-C-methyl-D-erythritol kinase [Chitinophagaceae bacterium]